MGCRVLIGNEAGAKGVDNVACLWDSVTGIAFGAIFQGPDALEQANDFCTWCDEAWGLDPRSLPEADLLILQKLHRIWWEKEVLGWRDAYGHLKLIRG